MRLRKKKNAPARFARCADYTVKTEELPENFYRYFSPEKPLELEIGSGKGRFIVTLAEQNPEKQFIAVERVFDCLVMAMEKAKGKELENIRFFCLDAGGLQEFFPRECADVIYLNFSDPWPKDRHAKRRLTSDRFLAVYDQILDREGVIEFKTDNQELFRFSLESIPQAGWKILEKTFDLHHSDMAQGNVMTEYEEKFSAEGKPICKLTARR